VFNVHSKSIMLLTISLTILLTCSGFTLLLYSSTITFDYTIFEKI
jgi:hypothetical protein